MLLLLIFITVILCVLLAVNLYVKKVRPMQEKAKKIPGPPTLPILGNALEFGGSTKEFFDYIVKTSTQYGPVARVWVGPILAVILAEPISIEAVLGSNKLINKSILYKFGEPWLGQGMLTNGGSVWKRHRKIITPAFHVQIFDKFLPIFNENVKILLERLKKHEDGVQFNIQPYMHLVALDIISESAMGVKINAQQDSTSDYVKSVKSLGMAMFIRAFKPWLHLDAIFHLSSLGRLQRKCLAILHGTTQRVIKERKKVVLENECNNTSTAPGDEEIGKKEKSAFLDLMLQAVKDGATLTDKELQDEVDTIMLAGHDTTTCCLSFSIWCLAQHQDIQDKVMEELNQIFGDSDREPTIKDLQEMKYMELVFKETLRVYPSVPLYGRILTEDVAVGEYVLPAGTNVGFNPYILHRNPEYYPDPEKFDPERFLPENSKGRHPFAYIPFSAGPRICLGMKYAMAEMKAVLSAVLRKYKILPPETDHKLKLTIVLVLESLNGIPIRLQKRNQN
ncbi:cytochrome P450 4C1-like isoform X1 [Periplaneta americana]|uniref:cytochrome P450 4C1-like isoform X1 n=1 Tax=Periplaneta americana TaxID=6978 RepID=UPI0037E90073